MPKKAFYIACSVEKLAYQLGEQNTSCDYGTNLAFSLVHIVYCLYYYYVTQHNCTPRTTMKIS